MCALQLCVKIEKSGLEKDREYFVQQSFARPDGTRVLPDVVLHLPDNKKMIIDSKRIYLKYNKIPSYKELYGKSKFDSPRDLELELITTDRILGTLEGNYKGIKIECSFDIIDGLVGWMWMYA